LLFDQLTVVLEHFQYLVGVREDVFRNPLDRQFVEFLSMCQCEHHAILVHEIIEPSQEGALNWAKLARLL